MNKHIIIIIVAVMIGFVGSETIIVTAQINSTSSERRNIIVTWLKDNTTMAESDPETSISNKDFWDTLSPLLEQLDK